MNVGDYMTIEELAKKTVMELKSYAKKNDIDLFGVSTKLLSKEASEKWITRKAVRIAQPEEVASYYGK